MVALLLVGAFSMGGGACGGATGEGEQPTGSFDARPGADGGGGADRLGAGGEQSLREMTPDLGPWPAGETIKLDEVWRRLQAGDPKMLLVNVSDEQFYNLGHIRGSLKIPWDQLDSRHGEIEGSRKVVLYCRRGVRTEAAWSTLTKKKGFDRLWKMEGGLEAWLKAGHPVER